jgi:UDPglucose--hexose-1-phosphate uridylyltransferase
MPPITKHVTRLSDGRELIYFDDADTELPAGRAADARPAVPRPALPELRQDPLTGEWISIAAARHNRAFLPPATGDWLTTGLRGPCSSRPSPDHPADQDHRPPAA